MTGGVNSSGFPTFKLDGAVSPDPVAGAVAPTNALAAIGQEAEGLGRQIGEMQTEAAKVQGQRAAAADVEAGRVQARQDGTVKGEAYDTVAKNFLGSQRTAALAVDMQKAYEADPDNPTALGPALDAVVQGYKNQPTPYADLNAELDGHYLVRRADFLARAVAGQRAASIAQDKANFTLDLSSAEDLLDQTADGASADDAGGQRVAAASQLAFRTLAKYGPKETFDFGGIHFDADPNRRAALNPDALAQVADKLRGQAVKTWIEAAGRQLPDEGSRKVYAAQVEAKWKGGDPSFAGVSGQEMSGILRELDASADRARADDNAQRVEYGRKARDAIEAFTWGGDPDLAEAAANAKLSGDPGLVAQVDFYKNADVATKGVLRSVVARQLGLLGPNGPQPVVVDATGKPVGPDPAAVAGQIAPDAAGYFGRLIGKPVTITSAARSPDHNAAVGGSPTSEHLPGNGAAWDIVVPGQSSAETFAQLAHAGVPFDQLIDEHDHVHFGIGPQMRGQAMVRGANGGVGNAWTVPATIPPGSPAYVAWASTQDGFTSDPMKYARGGANRPAIANVPILVPNGAFQAGDAATAWGAALNKRYQLGQTLAQAYGVPPRMLDGGEVDYYNAQIKANPQAGITLARQATAAIGPVGAQQLLRELGQSAPQANVNLHIADLYAQGVGTFATLAQQGIALQAEGKSVPEADKQALGRSFDELRGAVPPTLLATAYATGHAALIADQAQGNLNNAIEVYRNDALGRNAWQGRAYGGPAKVNGAWTVLPTWLNPDQTTTALRALGASWAASGRGPVWANGQPATADQLAGMQLQAQPSGRYRFVNPRTGNALMKAGGGAYEADLDVTRGWLAQALGPTGVRPLDVGR